MLEPIERIQNAGSTLQRELSAALVAGARERCLSVECDKAVYLIAPDQALLIASVPVAALYAQKLEALLDGEPVLLVYFPEVQLKDGASLKAGFYTVRLRAQRQVAEFIDAEGRTAGTGSLLMGARAPGGALKAKRVSADIDGPDLCYEACVKVCLTLKIDLPGPINPEFKICVEIIIKV